MPRNHDAHRDELEGVAQRLRDERPQASPLDLDRIKTTAMARAKSGSRRGRAGARRLAVASLTVGLLAATTGGVLAGGSGHKNKGGGNAASAQYGGECNITNGSGNIGDNNGAGAENYACNENSFNNITETNNVTNNVTNTYNSSTVTVAAPVNNGVLGSDHVQESKDEQQAREDPHQPGAQLEAQARNAEGQRQNRVGPQGQEGLQEHHARQPALRRHRHDHGGHEQRQNRQPDAYLPPLLEDGRQEVS